MGRFIKWLLKSKFGKRLIGTVGAIIILTMLYRQGKLSQKGMNIGLAVELILKIIIAIPAIYVLCWAFYGCYMVFFVLN